MHHSTKTLAKEGGLLLAVAVHFALISATLYAQQPQSFYAPVVGWESPPHSGMGWIARTSHQVARQPGPYLEPIEDPASCPEAQLAMPSATGGVPSEELPTGVLPCRPFRHLGMGRPLQGSSWLNRPYYAGACAGSWIGDRQLTDQVDQDSGFFSGYWLGSDLSHYWGCELRLSLFYVDIQYRPEGTQGGSTRNVLGDVNLLYYPWGDAQWRPYGSLGLGVGGFHFLDRNHVAVNHTGVELPVGFGVKYLCRNWLAVRFDVKDNLIFGGNDVQATSNWSLTGGVEVHWGGGSSARYYPW